MRGDILLFQHSEGLGCDGEASVEASGEDNDRGAPLQQSLHIGRLYAGIVARTRLIPVPLFRSSGVEASVFEATVLGLQTAPGELRYPWRARCSIHTAQPLPSVLRGSRRSFAGSPSSSRLRCACAAWHAPPRGACVAPLRLSRPPRTLPKLRPSLAPPLVYRRAVLWRSRLPRVGGPPR